MKKLLSILLIVMLSGSIAPVAAFIDTEGTIYEESVEILHSLGIISGKTELAFEPYESVTRAEMAKIAAGLYGNAVISKSETIFSDVAGDHWAHDYIGFAYNMGLVSGVDSLHFEPDGNLTLPQAVKIIVNVLGYGVMAESRGGYPSGYMAIASREGILKGVPQTEGAVTRGALAILTANALDVSLLVPVSYGGNGYTSKDSGTILSEYFDLEKHSGQVTADKHKRLSGEEIFLHENEISLNGLIFDIGAIDGDYFGHFVDLYSDGEGKVFYIRDQKNSSLLKIDAGQLINETTRDRIYYTTSAGENKAVITGADVAVNGRPVSGWSVSDIIIDKGSLTLISKDGNKYNTVIITSYVNKTVDSVSITDHKVYFTDDTFLDFDDKDCYIELKNYDGTDVEFKKISKWNILSVAASQDGKYIKVLRSDRSITGVIAETDGESAVIDGREYKISKGVSTSKIQGLSMTVYIDSFNEIADYDKKETDTRKYGYFLSMGETEGLDKQVQLKILTHEGKVMIFNTAGKVTLINNNMNTASVYSKQNFFMAWDMDFGAARERMIKYEVNGKGEITLVETALDLEFSGERNGVFSADVYLSGKQQYIKQDMQMFDCKYRVDSDCVIFTVGNGYSEETKDDYGVISVSDLIHGPSGNYENLTLYDVDEENKVHAFTIPAPKGTIDTDAVEAIITNVGQSINASGEDCISLNMFNNKGFDARFNVPNDFKILFGNDHPITDINKESQKKDGKLLEYIYPAALKPGDIVRYKTDTSDNIISMAVMLRHENPIVVEKSFTDAGIRQGTSGSWSIGNPTYYYSEVAAVLSYGIKVIVHPQNTTGGANTAQTFTRISVFKSKTYLYDSKKKTVTAIDPNQINVGDKVFASRATGTEKWMIIFR